MAKKNVAHMVVVMCVCVCVRVCVRACVCIDTTNTYLVFYDVLVSAVGDQLVELLCQIKRFLLVRLHILGAPTQKRITQGAS